MARTPKQSDTLVKRPLDPFRRAVVRGLGVLLPPLLTIVIFLWVGNTVANYLLVPMENWAERMLVRYAADIRPETDFPDAGPTAESEDQSYQRVGDQFVPQHVYDVTREKLGVKPMPKSAEGVYQTFVRHRWMQRQYVIPLFLSAFILILYLFGKFLAAGMGRFFWSQFESIIDRLPLVRNVYSSVKQVTDFLFTDPDLEYTRVVAVEYPRKGIWTVAFVTGESMLDIESAANEPVMSVLIPTSPMPFTGFTITVKKSESIDLNITVDQAFQFIISCGVVVPTQQLTVAAERNGVAVLPGSETSSSRTATSATPTPNE